MRNNKYTQTVNEITAPEGAVEKMLETARNYKKKEKVIYMKRWIKGTVAASLAIAVTAGAAIGFGSIGGDKGNSFALTVNAAEITKDNPVSVVKVGHGEFEAMLSTDETDYIFADLPVIVKGENIKSVTYSVENNNDWIAVHCRKGNNPVIDGKIVENDNNSPTIIWKKDPFVDTEEFNALTPDELEEKYEYNNYSSITLDYNNQKTDGCEITISGKRPHDSASDNSTFELQNDTCKTVMDTIVNCTIKYDDGSEQTQAIKITSTVKQLSSANTNLTKEEIELKEDSMERCVTYSIIE